MRSDKNVPNEFTLAGFTHENGARRFTFDRTGASRPRTQFTVRADLALIKVYGIHMQELPLLCRELLKRRADLGTNRDLTFTEEEMKIHMAARLAAAEKKSFSRPSGRGGRVVVA